MTEINDNLYGFIKGYVKEYFSSMDIDELGENVYYDIISVVDLAIISEALDKTNGNKIKAAKILGLNRNTVHAKIKKLNI